MNLKIFVHVLFLSAALIITALSISACATESSPTRESGRGDAPSILELNPYVGRLVTVQAQIGSQSYPFLLDTGGGWTTVTPKVAEAIGCKPFGRIAGFRMSGEQISTEKCGPSRLLIDHVAFEGDLGVFDVMALLPKELPELGGVLALSSLKDRPFTLDLASRQLTLLTPESLKRLTRDLEPGRIRIGRESAGYGATVFVEVAASPEPLWFLLDSGNLDAVIVDPHSLPQLGISPDASIDDSGDETFALDLLVAGQPVSAASARVRDIIYDGALSEAVMRQFVITIDMMNETIWLEPKPDMAGVMGSE